MAEYSNADTSFSLDVSDDTSNDIIDTQEFIADEYIENSFDINDTDFDDYAEDSLVAFDEGISESVDDFASFDDVEDIDFIEEHYDENAYSLNSIEQNMYESLNSESSDIEGLMNVMEDDYKGYREVISTELLEDNNLNSQEFSSDTFANQNMQAEVVEEFPKEDAQFENSIDINKDANQFYREDIISENSFTKDTMDTYENEIVEFVEDLSGSNYSELFDFIEDIGEDEGHQKVLKRNGYDLLETGDRNINEILEVMTDDYKDKGYSEAEIELRLKDDKINLQKEFLSDAFPNQEIQPEVFEYFTSPNDLMESEMQQDRDLDIDKQKETIETNFDIEVAMNDLANQYEESKNHQIRMLSEEVRKVRKPTEGFEGERGKWEENKFYFSNGFIPNEKFNPEQLTMEEIKNNMKSQYDIDIDGIPFQDGEPDFTNVSVANLDYQDILYANIFSDLDKETWKQMGESEKLERMADCFQESNRTRNFEIADQLAAERKIAIPGLGDNYTKEELSNWRKENKFSWDEQLTGGYSLVPTVVHGSLAHTGLVAHTKNGFERNDYYQELLKKNPEFLSFDDENAPISIHEYNDYVAGRRK